MRCQFLFINHHTIATRTKKILFMLHTEDPCASTKRSSYLLVPRTRKSFTFVSPEISAQRVQSTQIHPVVATKRKFQVVIQVSKSTDSSYGFLVLSNFSCSFRHSNLEHGLTVLLVRWSQFCRPFRIVRRKLEVTIFIIRKWCLQAWLLRIEFPTTFPKFSNKTRAPLWSPFRSRKIACMVQQRKTEVEFLCNHGRKSRERTRLLQRKAIDNNNECH